MYIDPEHGLLPHSGWHDENRWCRTVKPYCTPAGEEGATAGVTNTGDTSSYDPPPSHYDGGNGLDVWAIWDAYDLDRYLAPAVKYICRAGKKNGESRLKDLNKARNYIAKAIEMEEKRGAGNE
jgi:hypothetical protein